LLVLSKENTKKRKAKKDLEDEQKSAPKSRG